MSKPRASKPAAPVRLLLITGPAGAGRSTALHILEDLGFEAIDNMPLSLVPRLVRSPLERPLALGLDPRNRDFSVAALLALTEALASFPNLDFDLVYLDCTVDALVRRYSETRRRHPLAPDRPAREGIEAELQLLTPVRARADVLLDTSALSPHDLRSEVERQFAPNGGTGLTLQVQSFSFKRGLPIGVDMVFDCRFLNNPHWREALRPLDGRAPDVAAYVEADPRFADFFRRVHDLVESLLPEYASEGKTQLSIAMGCTGGQHRSVVAAEKLANALETSGWRVSKRHRELERNGAQLAAPREEE